MRRRKSTIGYPIAAESDNRFGANSNVGAMNAYAVSRRSAAAILAVSALVLGACSDSGDAADATTTVTETAAEGTFEQPSPTTEETSTSEQSGTGDESDSDDDSADAGSGDVTKIDADGIAFEIDDIGMMCWVGQQAFLNCQGTAEWTPTTGPGPANSLSFDMNAESIQAMQANANMADLDIEEVDAGGRYEVRGIIFDLSDSGRMTFTDDLSGTSGYVTADRYGWS